MTERRAYRLEFYVISFAVLFAAVYLAWQVAHGGVVTHHLLDQRSLPGFSNWWGLAIIPLIGWLAAWSVQRRAAVDATALTKAAAAAVGALLVGVALSISFAIDRGGNATFYIFVAALASGLALPTYRAEYVFGFVIGMSVVFGLVLPSILALVAVTISVTFHFLVRPAFVWTVRRVRAS
ncbi:MAG TPA: hypothetical protein VMF11_07165 [Candidatus Baltobacteraceae bacterium]|nr:hypothetical protein [Candidatus Baltobacteraceae bacterium]